MKTKNKLWSPLAGSVLAGCLLISTQVIADSGADKWEKFINLPDTSDNIYIERASVKTPNEHPNWRQLNVLVQSPPVDSDFNEISKVVTLTFDCENATARRDAHYDYEKPWATGEFENLYDAGDWYSQFRTFDSDSGDDYVMRALYREICTKGVN